MQNVKIVITLILTLLLQMLLPKHLRFFRYIELTLLVTVYFSLMRNPVRGMLIGVAAGIGGDAISGIPGVGGFTKTLIGYIISTVSIKFPLENPLARLGVVAAASVANTVLMVGLLLMLDQSTESISGGWGEFGRTIGWKTLGDTLTSIPLFLILDRVFSEQAQATRMAVKRRFYE